MVRTKKLPAYNEAVLGTPSKMLPDNTNMIYAHYLSHTQDTLLGKARETFFVNQLCHAGEKVYYSKIADYQVGNYTHRTSKCDFPPGAFCPQKPFETCQ